MALEKLDGVCAAYVSQSIQLHLTSKDAYDKKKVTETLKLLKMTIKKETSTEDSPFAQKVVKG